MGNILCKDPYNNPTRKSYKGPSSRKSKSFENVMFPSNNNLNNSQKNSTIATLESWNPTTVISNEVILKEEPPVAPPRKKRQPGLPSKSNKTLPLPKNGFKDVFGTDTRRHSANGGQDTVDKSILRQSSPISEYDVDANDDKFSDFLVVPTKHEVEKSNIKLPKVGNKKSDKFFGESLSSSLSEEPYYATVKGVRAVNDQPETDKLDEFVEKNILSEQTTEKTVDEKVKISSLDRKAEFLMAMLEDYSDSKRYGNAVPVTEDIIVPKKRKTKHICDDEDKLHDHLHKHEHKIDQSNKLVNVSAIEPAPVPVVEEIIVPKRRKSGHVCDDEHHLRNCLHHHTKKLLEVEATIENPPKKPDRDFSKFKMTVNDEQSNLGDAAITNPPEKITRKKSKKDAQDLIQFDISVAEPKSPKEFQRMISAPDSLKSPHLVKNNSTNCFLDLKKCQSMDNFAPEDHHLGCDDQLVLPTSKLSSRKISTKSMPPPTTELLSSPKFLFSSSESGHSTPIPEDNQKDIDIFNLDGRENESDANVARKISTKSLPTTIKIPTNEITHQSKSIPEEYVNKSIENENIEEAKPINILKDDVQEGTDDVGMITDVGTFIASSHILDDQQLTNVIDKIYESNKNILKDFQAFLEKQVTTDQIENEQIDLVESDIQNENITNENINEDENEQTSEVSDEVGEILPHHMVHVEMMGSARRESIEDVDSWFNKLSCSSSTEEIYGNRKGRPDGPTIYDTSRQFPFGEVRRERNDSSSELFDVGVRNRSGSTGHSDLAQFQKNRKIYRSDETMNKDHSTLLKFLSENNEF